MDFTSLYSTRIKTTFDDDQAAIFNMFIEKQNSKSGSAVTLTNYYNGLPINYPAKVLGVEHGNLDLDVNPQQAIAMSSDRYTLIRTPLFPDPIVAHVQYVNVKKHMASLNKLCFVEVLAEKRMAVRLSLDPPVRATILHGEQGIAGNLVDISTQGLAITVDEYITLEKGGDMAVKFMLPDSVLLKQTLVKVPATLVDLVGNASPYRFRFKISPDKHQEQMISRYIFQRQVELIKGLKETAE